MWARQGRRCRRHHATRGFPSEEPENRLYSLRGQDSQNAPLSLRAAAGFCPETRPVLVWFYSATTRDVDSKSLVIDVFSGNHVRAAILLHGRCRATGDSMLVVY